jgi:hypothetical protein
MKSLLAGIALAGFAASAAAQHVGVFPDLYWVWDDAPGPIVAAGAHVERGGLGNYVAEHAVTYTPGELVQTSMHTPDTNALAIAATRMGTHHAYGEGADTNSLGGLIASATATSIWKDRVTFSASGQVAFNLFVEGSMPPPGTNGSAAVYLHFGLFREDGSQAAYGHFTNTQSGTPTWEWGFASRNGGFLGGGSSTFPNLPGYESFSLTMTGPVETGTYELRSWFTLGAGANDENMWTFADYLNTAGLDFVEISDGTLTSASGMLAPGQDGLYRYPVSVVPEPSTAALMLLGCVYLGRLRQASRGAFTTGA